MDQFLYSVNIIGSHHTINPYITEICRGMPGKKIKEACYSLKAIRTILDIVMHLINTTHTLTLASTAISLSTYFSKKKPLVTTSTGQSR